MKTETPREIASGLVSKWVPILERQQPNYLHPLIDAIEAALNAERERAAKIAEDIMPIGADDCYWCERVQRAAAAIRGKD